MASQLDVKQRIQSVSNTMQITKAMQLVAASKLRKAQEAALGAKEFIVESRELLSTLAGHPDAMLNPLFTANEAPGSLTIIIASDRGLAGAYNANVLKAATAHLIDEAGKDAVVTVGKYASRFAARLKSIDSIGAYELDTPNLAVDVVKPVLTEMLESFKDGKYTAVHCVYTKYISTIKQEVIVEQILPITSSTGTIQDRIFEPSAEVVFEAAIKRTLEAQLLQYMLEARASEHASRMLAMKNATDNAEELIDDLTLVFNNARQAKITQELAEISAGAEALK